MAYTVIGENVNLAARLESANKYYGTVVLLSGATVDALKSSAVLRRLDLIQVKGLSRPTWVYESLGHHTGDTFPLLPRVIKAYEAGLDCYSNRDWQRGGEYFAQALEMAPATGRPASSSTDAVIIRRTHPSTNERGLDNGAKVALVRK